DIEDAAAVTAGRVARDCAAGRVHSRAIGVVEAAAELGLVAGDGADNKGQRAAAPFARAVKDAAAAAAGSMIAGEGAVIKSHFTKVKDAAAIINRGVILYGDVIQVERAGVGVENASAAQASSVAGDRAVCQSGGSVVKTPASIKKLRKVFRDRAVSDSQ